MQGVSYVGGDRQNFGMPPFRRADAFRTDCGFEIRVESNLEKIASIAKVYT